MSTMMTPDEILKAALNEPDRDPLKQYLGAVFALREKSFSWREIADFLGKHGVKVEHTKLLRLYTKHRSLTMNVPDAGTYEKGLRAIAITEQQLAMLKCHYLAHNRTVTYTELAAASGSSDYRKANLVYGGMGRLLGEEIGYTFPIADEIGKPFYSGSLGMDAPKSEKNEYQLTMHHELSKAIANLGWFQ
jgi:hypothetical protein